MYVPPMRMLYCGTLLSSGGCTLLIVHTLLLVSVVH